MPPSRIAAHTCDDAISKPAVGRNISEIHRLSKLYHKAVIDEGQTSLEKFAVESVGKIDARKRLQESVDSVMGSNILQILGTMLDSVAF